MVIYYFNIEYRIKPPVTPSYHAQKIGFGGLIEFFERPGAFETAMIMFKKSIHHRRTNIKSSGYLQDLA